MTAAEASGLEFYATCLAPLLDATFSCSIWGQTAMSISNSRPFILHFILGLSYIYQARRIRGDGTLLDDELHQAARSQYARALAEMRLHIDDIPRNGTMDNDKINATALACLLSVSFHLLLGERSFATSHWRHGVKILQSVRTRKPCELDSIYNVLDNGSSYFETQPLPFWTQADCSVVPAVTFSNLADAHTHLDILVTELYQIRDEMLRQVARKLQPNELPLHPQERKVYIKCALSNLPPEQSSLLPSIHHLHARLQNWLHAYHTLTPDKNNIQTRETIRTFYKTFYARQLLAALQHQGSAMCYDAFLPDYRRVLFLSRKYLAFGPIRYSAVDQPLIAGPELLHPVFSTAIRCRDPLVRRSALEILREAERGTEDTSGGFYAAAVERVVAMEEEAARQLHALPAGLPLTGAAEVPEGVRLREVQIVVPRGNSQRAELILGRYLANGRIHVMRETLQKSDCL